MPSYTEFSNIHRGLGIAVTSNLCWLNHYNQICSKAYRASHLIHHTPSPTSPSVWGEDYRYIFLLSDLTLYTVLSCRTFLLTINQGLYPSIRYCLHNQYEFQNVLLLIKSLSIPIDNLDIFNCHFRNWYNEIFQKLKFNQCTNTSTSNFYFNRIVRIRNALPTTDISQTFITIKN